MRIPATVRIAALGLELAAEIELPDDAFRSAPATETPFLSDVDLRRRWKRSARTLARMRAEGKLPFSEPRPRTYLYAVADVEAIERGTHVASVAAAPRKARG